MADPSGEAEATNEAPPAEPEATAAEAESPQSPELLRARLAVLEEENRQLREEYASARRSQYRTTALGLAALGLVAVAGTVITPGERTVLFALAGTGFFGALLTWTLTPEEFVAASIGEQITASYAADRDALSAELGLQDDHIYVPTDDTTATLFVPQRPNYELPDAFDGLLIVPENASARGVAFTPTGAPLYQTFRDALAGEPADDPGSIAAQLADSVVEQFELARSATVAPDRTGSGVAVRVERPTFGTLETTDHPVISTIATGLAVELDRPVDARVADTDGETTVLEFTFADR